ncbi:hypothetical protein SUNI508_03346 [Seiridium unicorne]|uniref:Uncharacterized protein n=1 Tax=Seiridium unicorne TaxID=138068 RepID=A0ABR2VEG3_9PEZI
MSSATHLQQSIIARHPNNDQDHPSAGSPYFAGSADPGKGGGADGQHASSAAEIGIIIGVVCLVLVAIAALFFMRARKKKKNEKDAEATAQANQSPLSTADDSTPMGATKKMDDDRATCSSDGNAAVYSSSHVDQGIHISEGSSTTPHAQRGIAGQDENTTHV